MGHPLDRPTIASNYFSIGISKYISSVPLALLTPVMAMWAEAREMSPTSKKRNPDWVVWGSTALAANCEDSISSRSFWVMAPFTFLRGMGIGLGRVAAWGLVRRR